MSAIVIGHAVGEFPSEVAIDYDALLRTRLLISGSSGAGKSHAFRRLLEQVHGRLPFVMIDPEGEFASLRERLDVLLVGKGGDVPADVRSAPLLARFLLEKGVSAVVDLFELKNDARHAWVAAFVPALMDAPRELWRDLLVGIDEGEDLAPEKGAGSSEALSAVMDLAKRGRKRGYGLAIGALRLSAMNKNVGAQLGNALAGRTTIDVDLDRVADMMGVRRGRARDDFQQGLRRLQPGQFWALGPAFRPALEAALLVKIGPVTTTHPQPGARPTAPPPPTAAIRHLLPRLADLPKEAEREERETEVLRAELRRVRGELEETRRSAPPAPERVEVRVPMVPEGLIDDTDLLIARARAAYDAVKDVISDLSASRTRLREMGVQVWRPGDMKVLGFDLAAPDSERSAESKVHQGSPRPRAPAGEDGDLPRGARAMLEAVAGRGVLTRTQLATLASVAPSGGTFAKYLSILKTGGLVDVVGDTVTVTAKGLGVAGDVARPRRPGDVLALWREKMPGKARDMLELFAAEHGPFTKDQIAKRLDLDAGGGTFAKYLSILRSNGLVMKGKGGMVVNPELAL